MSKTKNKTKDVNKEEEARAEGQVLCCVPNDVVECVHREITEVESSTKMGCSNLQCSSPRLLHQKCFDKLEKNLVTATQRLMPKSRKLTEAQLKANIWDIRGQEVLKKMCKCRCGGTLRREEELEVALPLPGVQKKEKVSPKKPKLNCLPGKICEQKSFFKRGQDARDNRHFVEEQFKLKPVAEVIPPSSAKLDQASSKPGLPLYKSDLPLLKSDLTSNQRIAYGSSYKTEDPKKKLFVYHLLKECSEDDLIDLFKAYGNVVYVWISTPPSTYAFVLFESAESVDKVMADLPLMLYGYHPLRVERKKSSEEHEGASKLYTIKEEPNQTPAVESQGKSNAGSKTNALADANLLSKPSNPSCQGNRNQEEKQNPATPEETPLLLKNPIPAGSSLNEKDSRGKTLLGHDTEKKEQLIDFYWSDGEDQMVVGKEEEKEDLKLNGWAMNELTDMVRELLRLKEVTEAERQKLETENEVLRKGIREKEVENGALREERNMLEEALAMTEKISEGRKNIIDTMYAQVTLLKPFLKTSPTTDEEGKGKEAKDQSSGTSTPENWERSS